MLGYVPPEQPPQLTSIYPTVAVNKVNSGKLPTIVADKIILQNGEVCHFVDVAAVVTEKKRRMTTHMGGSYHIFKGYTAHLGQSQSIPVSEPHYTRGILYVTNQRIIFVARENGFDKKIKALTALTSYSDGVSLQFGGKTYAVMLPAGTVVHTVIGRLI